MAFEVSANFSLNFKSTNCRGVISFPVENLKIDVKFNNFDIIPVENVEIQYLLDHFQHRIARGGSNGTARAQINCIVGVSKPTKCFELKKLKN